jgi:hypothetical protein
MTLVEMLVATTLTLIIMGVIAQLFGILGNSISRSRATLITSAQLRAVSHALRIDLAGVTAPTVPPVAADGDAGYLEIIEGIESDTSRGTSQLIGDCDDALLFTTSTLDRPYVGVFSGTSTIESRTAEVAWFCRPSDVTTAGMTLYNLYRRQLLVLDYVGAGEFVDDFDKNNAPKNRNRLAVVDFGSLPSATFSVLQSYDISLRAEGTEFVPNTLGDLTKRENRFAHNPSGTVSGTAFPYAGTSDYPLLSIRDDALLADSRQGEEIVLRNVLAFDVRVFDPEAAIRSAPGSSVGLVPGDPGYATSGTTPLALGCYVDLGSGAASTTLMGTATALSKLTRIYDTWSTHYECNGIDENKDGVVDGGSDGLDNNMEQVDEFINGVKVSTFVIKPDGVVDDDAERDTQPPYPVPLRGIEIRIRCYEPSSREVRQVTVRHTFVPH